MDTEQPLNLRGRLIPICWDVHADLWLMIFSALYIPPKLTITTGSPIITTSYCLPVTCSSVGPLTDDNIEEFTWNIARLVSLSVLEQPALQRVDFIQLETFAATIDPVWAEGCFQKDERRKKWDLMLRV